MNARGAPRIQNTFATVASVDDLMAAPARRIVLHRSFAYWQAEHRAFGSIIWGRPDEADVGEMCAAHEVGANPRFAGHASIIDLRALEGVDFLAFDKLLAYLKQRRDAWSPNVSRQVVLHGGGFAHSTVVGMFQFLSPGHKVIFSQDPRETFELAGVADVFSELEAMRAEFLGAPDIVRRTRVALEGLPARASVSDIARRVGTSERSLQRRLAEAGTSLRDERRAHIVRVSERLLLETELDLEAIAAHVGVSSGSQLVKVFRKLRGTTPGALRQKHLAS